MRSLVIAALFLVAAAGPAAAETRYLAYDASDRVTQALTRGVTLEADRGLFGAISVRRIISTSNRGSAEVRRGGPEAVRRALPEGATETAVYTISPDGDGRGLTRALTSLVVRPQATEPRINTFTAWFSLISRLSTFD